jgi:hypothetical protein
MEFTRKPSDSDRINERITLPEGEAILIADVPDWVNVPNDLVDKFNLPMARAEVLKADYLNFQGRICLHYKTNVLIEGRHLWVAKGTDQFYWHLRD